MSLKITITLLVAVLTVFCHCVSLDKAPTSDSFPTPKHGFIGGSLPDNDEFLKMFGDIMDYENDISVLDVVSNSNQNSENLASPTVASVSGSSGKGTELQISTNMESEVKFPNTFLEDLTDKKFQAELFENKIQKPTSDTISGANRIDKLNNHVKTVVADKLKIKASSKLSIDEPYVDDLNSITSQTRNKHNFADFSNFAQVFNSPKPKGQETFTNEIHHESFHYPDNQFGSSHFVGFPHGNHFTDESYSEKLHSHKGHSAAAPIHSGSSEKNLSPLINDQTSSPAGTEIHANEHSYDSYPRIKTLRGDTAPINSAPKIVNTQLHDSEFHGVFKAVPVIVKVPFETKKKYPGFIETLASTGSLLKAGEAILEKKEDFFNKLFKKNKLSKLESGDQYFLVQQNKLISAPNSAKTGPYPEHAVPAVIEKSSNDYKIPEPLNPSYVYGPPAPAASQPNNPLLDEAEEYDNSAPSYNIGYEDYDYSYPDGEPIVENKDYTKMGFIRASGIHDTINGIYRFFRDGSDTLYSWIDPKAYLQSGEAQTYDNKLSPHPVNEHQSGSGVVSVKGPYTLKEETKSAAKPGLFDILKKKFTWF